MASVQGGSREAQECSRGHRGKGPSPPWVGGDRSGRGGTRKCPPARTIKRSWVPLSRASLMKRQRLGFYETIIESRGVYSLVVT